MKVRPPPKAILGKIGRRACPAIYLHNSQCTPGAVRVALLGEDGGLAGVADRRTARAVLQEDGKWAFPDVASTVGYSDVQNSVAGPPPPDGDEP